MTNEDKGQLVSSRYMPAYFCVKCDAEHTYRVHSYSRGMCPFCGFKNDGSFTKVVVRRVRIDTFKKKFSFFFNLFTGHKTTITRTVLPDNAPIERIQ